MPLAKIRLFSKPQTEIPLPPLPQLALYGLAHQNLRRQLLVVVTPYLCTITANTEVARGGAVPIGASPVGDIHVGHTEHHGIQGVGNLHVDSVELQDIQRAALHTPQLTVIIL